MLGFRSNDPELQRWEPAKVALEMPASGQAQGCRMFNTDVHRAGPSHGYVTAVCQAEGEVTARQRNRMSTLQAVTGVAAPDAETLDASAANAWVRKSYAGSEQRPHK